jgi:hypothetical protein
LATAFCNNGHFSPYSIIKQKTYPRFCACSYSTAMKLDLIEINKLSPPGLWDLGVLAAVISMLRGVIRAGVGGHVSAPFYGRMVLRYSESLRAKTRDNLNMRIKAWVMQCPARVAHVRGVIGEAAIRRWHTNRLADYALSKYFGDWKRKWPHGFNHGFNGGSTHETTKPKCTPRFNGKTRPYTWQPFALVKALNVQGFLYRKPASHDREMQDAYIKLWGVDITDIPRLAMWTQPRQPRTTPPIRFTPTELDMDVEPEAETSPLIDAPSIITMQDAPRRIEGKVENSKLKPGVPPSDEKPP